MEVPQLDKENIGISHENIEAPPVDTSGFPKKTQLQPLVSVIQQHLIEQSKKLFQDEIFKESVVKCSLDKDFAYLFEESGLKIKRQKPQTAIGDTKKPGKVYSASEKDLLRCVQSESPRSLIHIPFKDYLDCFETLRSKLEGRLVIVVCEFHEYYSERLEEINQRKDPIKWAALSSSLTLETKSKILQLYELQKLDLLLVSPELFENEKYQVFKCHTLFITSIHLFESKSELLERIIDQTEPERVIGGYEYLPKTFQKKLKWVNLGRGSEFEDTVWLKGTNKSKNLLSYLSRREYSKTLVVVRDKKSADELSCSLSLQAYKLANLFDFIPKQALKTFSMPALLTSKKDSLQSQLHESFRRCLSSSIIISPFFEGLRLFEFDLIVFYDQPSIKQYMELESLAEHRLGLLSDEDYYVCRNLQTSSIIDRSIFQKLVSHILERTPSKNNERKIKRFYSDSLSELELSQPPAPNIKSITINRYCHDYQISQPQLFGILHLLKELNMLVMMDPVKYECLIEERSAEQFKKTFANHNLLSRRINILNLASELKTTTQIVLETMKSNGIRFLVCEELLPLKILATHVESSVETAWVHQQQQVLRGIREIDLSYTLFEQFTFPNSEFIRKEKLAAKKKEMTGLFDSYLRGQLELSRLPLLKLNNVNKKTICEWVGDVMEYKLTVHDIVLFLQGTLNQRTSIHQDEPIFKGFYKCKYEELADLVESVRNKRQKIN